MAVLLETTLGDIVIDLFTEERPKTCLNFLKLCKIKYYNYCLIHNVQRDFIVQTGDPTGTGRGGESVYSKLYGDQARFFDAEKAPRIKHKKKGTVSMVNNGNDQHGSQFLITTGENLDYLDGVHTVFGEVTEGTDVLAKINETFVDKDFVPFQDIRINHTVILEDPFDDPPDLPVPDRSPEPTKEQLDSGRIGADEVIDDTDGKGTEELEERLKEKEAKTQAILLEMVGDLPDADVRPPENVLFVCKLNPVTTDEDLEIIFSRFGTIKSCEIIRDWKTGDSLCYAFIEFEKQEDCEKAYFKMDNVLIDDRRIHVDFSQSVAKIKWKGKGGKYTKDDFKAYEKDLDNRSKLALKDQVKTKQDSKYDLLIEDEEEVTGHRPSEKKHKEKRHHHYSDDEDGRKSRKHKDSEESWRDRKTGRQRSRSRSRSRSRDRGHKHSKSRVKHGKEGREKGHSHKDRSRSRSPKKETLRFSAASVHFLLGAERAASQRRLGLSGRRAESGSHTHTLSRARTSQKDCDPAPAEWARHCGNAAEPRQEGGAEDSRERQTQRRGAAAMEQQQQQQQQQHATVERFLKLGYSQTDILRVLESLRHDAQTNDILEELIKTCHTRTYSDKGAPESPKLVSRGCSPSPGQPRTRADREPAADFRPVVIDGSNVAMSHGDKKVFSCRGLQLAVNWFWDKGLRDITVFVPLWRKEQPRPEAPITDQHILHELEKRKILVYTPSRCVNGKRVVCYDDRYIIKLAYDSDGIVVSNDNYRDLQTENPQWKKFIEERLLMYTFANDKFMPPDDPLGRNGPTIDEFLRKKPWTLDNKLQHCPYGKKCTYGVKCKFYHPERANQSQLSVADELRALRDKAKNFSPKTSLQDTQSSPSLYPLGQRYGSLTPPPLSIEDQSPRASPSELFIRESNSPRNPPSTNLPYCLSSDMEETCSSTESSLSMLYIQDLSSSLDSSSHSFSSGVASYSPSHDDDSLSGSFGENIQRPCVYRGYHHHQHGSVSGDCPTCSQCRCCHQHTSMPPHRYHQAWTSCPALLPHNGEYSSHFLKTCASGSPPTDRPTACPGTNGFKVASLMLGGAGRLRARPTSRGTA
ncbi:hypothetical protein Q5P01_005362 [Channa striata]|uniref:Peptidyl-prolyl cis-trans isomerase-like 4 n=1 Tax=Channa striata TaxID=64152 RepID=A0AA88NGC7_CHASR|nr:hypothetical protein Q5P01_005362 [Channa striata]